MLAFIEHLLHVGGVAKVVGVPVWLTDCHMDVREVRTLEDELGYY